MAVVHDEEVPLRELIGVGVDGLDPPAVTALEMDHDVLVQAWVMLLVLLEVLGRILGLRVALPCTYTSTNTSTSICASTSTSLY